MKIMERTTNLRPASSGRERDSLAMISETEVEAGAYALGESIGNVVKPNALHRTVNDSITCSEEAARTLRNEVEAIASLAERDEATSRNP